MTFIKLAAWALVIVIATGHGANAEENNDNGKSVKDTARSVVKEVGKGFEAVGKVVGPAVGKAEKAVRDAAKDDGEKRDANRK